ncbi:RNA polymerase subunit sigma-24 [Rhodoferax lacus]|uniref:RNA polymerase subunit sigma-24 n=1 Tax=Rhodoferax lacus TaxID=2184758 RepID=A0A3E1RD56_9BURK|nr:sigma-70 family RNA polymerase sigma factor [Rhodoferax lacus]RFO97295.1 RNA polymerase subunit sigma-24 [Rhodoferax lacus]
MSRQSIVDHIPGLRRYARALTGDTWGADDLVQDTLERACSRWRLWLAGTDLRAWLFTLMHNLFISQVRQGLRRAELGRAVDIDDVAHELQAPAATPGLGLDLQRCLLRLPVDQRAVLLLVCVEDMAYTEVARVTGVPLGTVMSRLSRARERMRELLDEPADAAASHAVNAAPALRRLK